MNNQNTRSNDDDYLDSVINFYIKLPDTPVKPSSNDRITAASFLEKGIPIHTVEAALLLATVRRLARPDDATPLTPVRSLAYFAPVINEIESAPLPDGYQQYLQDKIKRLAQR